MSGIYILVDPVLIFVTTLIASSLYGGTVGKAWWLILGGLVFYLIADLMYTYLVYIKQDVTGSPIDSFWVIGFFLIAIAAMMTYSLFKSTR